jgi:hypothetical protein
MPAPIVIILEGKVHDQFKELSMPVRRNPIALPTANNGDANRRRRRPSGDIALAEPIVEGAIVPSGVDQIIKLEQEAYSQ